MTTLKINIYKQSICLISVYFQVENRALRLRDSKSAVTPVGAHQQEGGNNFDDADKFRQVAASPSPAAAALSGDHLSGQRHHSVDSALVNRLLTRIKHNNSPNNNINSDRTSHQNHSTNNEISFNYGHSPRLSWDYFDETGYVQGGGLRTGEDPYVRNRFNQRASDSLPSNRDIPDTRHPT